ncbi:hypothetical protein [Mycobacterium sp. 29Ha]|uniref:hypothetical protein n=1 Tax=Mycobacterium sp. 29Ha TaxID=2939268 RepID=UPI0039777896
MLAQGALLSTNTFDTVSWTVVTWLVVRSVRTRADRLLMFAAVVSALDFQVKWQIPFFWICAGVSILVFGPREMLPRPVLWLGAVVFTMSALPSLFWQMTHGWPQLQMGSVIAAEQDLVDE